MTAGTDAAAVEAGYEARLTPQDHRPPPGTALRRRRAREIAVRSALLRRVRQP